MLMIHFPSCLLACILLARTIVAGNFETLEFMNPVLRTVHEFPNGTHVENIHVRADGTLLVTTIYPGNLYAINPEVSKPKPELVTKFPGSDSVTGIAALNKEGTLFAVTGGIDIGLDFVPDSMSVYIVALSTRSTTGKVIDRIKIPGHVTLNAMVSLPAAPWIILSADSVGGQIFRINTRTRKFDIAIADPILGWGSNTDVPIGVNGIKLSGKYLYFSNSAQGIFGRIQIDANGNKVGTVQVLTSGVVQGIYDDFVLDDRGNALVTIHPGSAAKISPNGVQTPWLDNLLDPTAAAISWGGRTLFLTTAGSTSRGGQVLAVSIGQGY